MTKLELTKTVATFIVGVGTSKIVSGIVQHNTNPEKLSDQVSIAAASLVIGSMAADATRKYTDAGIDKVAAWYKENVKNR